MRFPILASAIAISGLLAGSAMAASVRVAPIHLDVASGVTTTTLRVWNTEKTPVRVQVRVFLWTHTAKGDTLTPTTDIVASPPINTLKPGAENLIRLVRTSTTPVGTRESYRVMVDQLPDPASSKPGTVAILVRHGIPLYFEH